MRQSPIDLHFRCHFLIRPQPFLPRIRSYTKMSGKIGEKEANRKEDFRVAIRHKIKETKQQNAYMEKRCACLVKFAQGSSMAFVSS